MADRVSVDLEETVAVTANAVARGIWFSSGKGEPTLENAEEFLDLLACCAYALRGRRVGIKPKE